METRGASLEITALATDLFRLTRFPRGQSAPPSWAVLPLAPMSPPPVPGPVVAETPIRLSTREATWTLHPTSGEWSLHDAHGLELFRASPPGPAAPSRSPLNHLTLALHPREQLFGLGETTGPLNKRGLIKEFWNIDVLGHAPAIHPGLRNLYVSIPFALSLRDGRAAGLFWDCPARQTWDLGATHTDQWTLSADSPGLDLYLFTGPSPARVVERFTELTGRIPLPPRWALGYQQCRYSYTSRTELERVAAEFRRRQLPCDVLYCDIHHLDSYRVFTFGKTYPKPGQMIAQLRRRGFKVVTIVDPGVKDDPRFGTLVRGRRLQAFVRDPQKRRDALGEVWPGRSRFPDFLHQRVRDWWGDEQRALVKLGVAGVWNDMNEPANF
ncbi:MAG: alpha-glucosidase, partial [Verrucomicrobiales bacterium]|nr:alpha-glucosidase [Verrucomicrobiales bacterium]